MMGVEKVAVPSADGVQVAVQSAEGVPSMLPPPPIPPIDGDEDAQTIYRLENECYKLRVSMAKVRKATQEWFFLETKLKNATDELDAAKEDRDLMLSGVGDISFGREIDAETSFTNTSSSGPAVVPLPLLSPIKTEDQIKREKIERDLQRIEGQLEDHPKFSPEWFKLKEELVELRIKLDEGDTKHTPVSSNGNKLVDEQSKKHNKENENYNESNWDNEVQLELPPQFHFRPISPPPSPVSPSTSSSLSLSKSRIVQPSPGKPIPDTPCSNYYNFNTDDQDSIDQRTLLRTQHAAACEELGKFPQFSQEWFAAKTKAVLIEDQLEELENRSHSCGGSNRSFSGWSENEEEVEAISCADELECVMVAEALKQGYCVSPSFVGDEKLQRSEEGLGLDIGDKGGDTAELGLEVLYTENQPEEDEPKTLLEPRFSHSLFNTVEDLQGQGGGGGAMDEDKYQLQEDMGGVNAEGSGTSPTQEDQREEESTLPVADKPTSAVDSKLDEFASMLENVQNYHALIIQEQWSIHRKSRPFKRMKSRALNHVAMNVVAQKEKGKGFNLVGFLKNILPKNKYNQWETFAAILIQNRWRSYQKRKKFQATVLSITKVQAVARCKQQHALFCKRREKVVTIQCMVRKHRASLLRRRLGTRVVASLLNESEVVLQELKYLQAGIKLQRFWRDSHARLQKMKEVNSLLEQSSYMLVQLTMLKSAVTIQRRWRVHREQIRYNKTRSNIFIIQGVVRGWLKQRTPRKIGQLHDKHDALSDQLDNLTKYSREWCDLSEQIRVLKEEIGKHKEMEESRHDTSSMRERSYDAPCIETESVDFAILRDTLEKKATASTPKLPDNRWNERFQEETTPPPATSRPHSDVQYKKSFEKSSSGAAEKSLSPELKESGTRKVTIQKKPPTLKELGIECLRLSKRLNQLPKFSPEWTLSKVELRQVTEEMEYLYESLKKGSP